MKKIVRELSCFIMVLVMVLSMIAPSFLGIEQVKAATPYYIQVNKNTNVVTVYKKKVNGVYKEPVKAFVCSVGVATPIGTFKTPAKYRWHTLDGPSYGQYCTRVVGGILFHSVWYYENGKNDSISVVQYNKLGTTASHGCIRLTVADAKWIYDNCPLGTEVKIIAGSSKNDPLGKPEALKLDTSKRTDWCPTDPDSRNPYAKKKPEIKGAKSKTIQLGETFDPLKGVTAKDTAGNDATKKIKVSGKVNTKKAGKYKLTYTVTDAIGRKDTAKVTITVKDDSEVVISAKNKKVQLGETFNPLKGVTAKTKAGTDRTSTLKVSGKVNTNKIGTYKLTYQATRPDGKKTKKTVTITVGDFKKPVLSGVKDRVIFTTDVATGSSIDFMEGVTAKATNGKDLTDRIKVTGKVNPHKVGTYKVTYSVTNDSNLTTKKTVTYTVKEPRYVALEGIKNLKLSYAEANMTDEEKEAFVKKSVLQHVTGYIMEKEQPDDVLVVNIEEQDLDYYFVTVTIQDGIGHKLEGQCYVTLTP